MKSWVAGVLAVAAFATNVANADMISPTGGILSSLGSEAAINGLGSFEVHGERYEYVEVSPVVPPIYTRVANGDAEVVLTADSLTLSGGAMGYSLYDWQPIYEGSVSGTFGFDVLEPGRLWLDWDFIGDDHEATVSISGADGVLLRCTGIHGCAADRTSEMWVSFDPGHYELSFSSHNEWGPRSIPIANEFSLTLSPVPLPAAAWLLLSGLGGLSFLRRRRPAYD